MRIRMHSGLPGHTVMAAQALDRNVGLTIPVRVGENETVDGKVVDAEVDEDGPGYTITLEIPDGLSPFVGPGHAGIAWSVE